MPSINIAIYVPDKDWAKYMEVKKEIKDEVKEIVKVKLNGSDNIQVED